MKDELFEAQLVRAIGYAPYGGADLGECLATAARIIHVDPSQWYSEWTATATRLQADGIASRSAGDHVSARSSFLRAANYFRTAGIFLMGAPLDPRLRESHRLEVQNFRDGAALFEFPPELIEIPYEQSSLPGYFFRPSGDETSRPTIILTNGYDGSAEELYFTNGAAALERGYNVLAFDGPGQGAMVLDRGVPFRPDWEHVITPIVDYLATRPEVDSARIALMGLSFGGYLAPRAAAFEHRIAACVSDCGPYDLATTLQRRLPAFLARQLPNGSPVLLALLNRILRSVMAKPTAGWALRRSLLVHDLAGPLDYFRLAPEYTLHGLEAHIECPTFVCSAEGDDLSVLAPTLFAALTCPKEYVQFRTADGAGEHCESGARTRFHQVAFNWLDQTLPVTPPPRTTTTRRTTL